MHKSAIASTIAVSLLFGGSLTATATAVATATVPNKTCNYLDDSDYPDPIRDIVQEAKNSLNDDGKSGENDFSYVQRVYDVSLGLDGISPENITNEDDAGEIDRYSSSCGDIVNVEGRWGVIVTPETYASVDATGAKPSEHDLPAYGVKYYTVNR